MMYYRKVQGFGNQGKIIFKIIVKLLIMDIYQENWTTNLVTNMTAKIKLLILPRNQEQLLQNLIKLMSSDITIQLYRIIIYLFNLLFISILDAFLIIIILNLYRLYYKGSPESETSYGYIVADEDEKILVCREKKSSSLYLQFCGLLLYSYFTFDNTWHHFVLCKLKII